MTEILNRALNKQKEFLNAISSSKEIQEQIPLFHFSTPGGWCNDPNGFSEYKGSFHLFYQYHPYSTKWGPMHWGHAVSKDFLHWETKPVALAPDTASDKEGCFSGTALESDGKHLLIYTGVSHSEKENKNFQNQCVAFGDGIAYTKLSENPVITSKDIPFEYKTEDFRDPKIWKKDGKFYLACVIMQKNDRGAIVMFESDNAIKWTYKGILDSSKDGLSNMWECPDISVIDGKDVLIFSPQGMKENEKLGFHNGNNSVYATGILDYENITFNREVRPENGYTAANIDYGIDFYAPETTRLSDGRTILIAWMQAWESYITPENYLWSGMMTLPRELQFKNNRLYQKPIRELECWKKEKRSFQIQTKETKEVFSNGKRHFQTDCSISENASGSLNFILKNAGEEIRLSLNVSERAISFDRTQTKHSGAISFRKEKLRTEEKAISLNLICDTNSLEVFINDGIMTFTNIFYFSKPDSDFLIENKTSEILLFNFSKIENPLKR